MNNFSEPTCKLTIDEAAELYTLLYRHTYFPPDMENANAAYKKIEMFLEKLARQEHDSDIHAGKR